MSIFLFTRPLLKCYFFFILYVFLLNTILLSQEIEENGSEKQTSNYWDKHFKLNFGTSYAKILDGQSYRSFTYADLTWKQDTKWIDFNIEALVYRRDFLYHVVPSLTSSSNDDSKIINLAVDIELEARRDPTHPRGPFPDYSKIGVDSICQTFLDRPSTNVGLLGEIQKQCTNKAILPTPYNFAITENNVLWREANVVLKFGDKTQLLLGNHVVVWGQSDFISPIDIYLPLRLGSPGTGLTKADNRNPQTMALLSAYPQKWMELQFYLFSDTGIDPVFLNLITGEPLSASRPPRERREKFYLPTGKDLFRYAARTLFYIDKTTIGLTWYNGFYQFGTKDNARLLAETEENKTVYATNRAPELQRINVFGFELAHSIGKWILKNDFSYAQITGDLPRWRLGEYNDQALGKQNKTDLFNKTQLFIDWVLKDNGGKLDIKQNTFINSIGADANLDRWLININFLVYYSTISDSAKRGRELVSDIRAETSSGDNIGFSVVPALNVAYYLDNQKKQGIGFAGGFLNAGFGGLLYYSKEFFESIKFFIDMEYISLLSDGIAGASVPSGYTIKNRTFPALRISLDYSL